MVDEEYYKKSIIEGLARLRKERRLSQAEFAKILGLSQQRLSEIEQGHGSISAERLVFLLQKFNLSLSYFVKKKVEIDAALVLQNTLVRLGAKYLKESTNVFVPEKFDYIDEVLFETLYLYPLARLIPALAPVIAANIQKVNFKKLEVKLYDLGIANRFYWVLESVLKSIQKQLSNPSLFGSKKPLYRRCKTILTGFLLYKKHIRRSDDEGAFPEDLLDQDIISEKTRQIVESDRDELARKWKIITRIKQNDFDQALVSSETYA